MKTLSTKTLLILLVAVLIVYFGLDFFDQSDSTLKLPDSLANFTVAQVSEARFTQDGKTLRLYRKDGSWFLDLGQHQPRADSNIVLRGLNNLASIKPNRLISKQRSKWAEYHVDSTGIRAELFDASQKKIADLVLGTLSPYGQSYAEVFTYVRAYDSDFTYAAPGFASESVTSKPYIYRTKTLISCMKDSILSIECKPKDEPAFQMIQTAPGQWKIANTKCDSAAANQWASDLESLSSIGFVDGAELGKEVAYVKVELRNRTEPVAIRFFESANGLLMTSSVNAGNVFSDTLYNKIIRSAKSLRK